MRMRVGLLLLLSLGLATTAQAVSRLNSYGTYAETNFGFGRVKESVAGSSRQDTEGFAWSLIVGQRLNMSNALELGYFQFPDQAFDDGVEGKSNYAFVFMWKLALPTDHDMRLFGKAGAGLKSHQLSGPVPEEGSSVKFAGMLGAGLDYAITSTLNATVQYNFFFKNSSENPAMWLVTGGFSYYFIT